ncbi:MAG TPA: hypothetical protein VE309_01680 [Caulobacteraceae bacterium]|jgi:hypothetical protein|nr:hypothetical protein [Caulobacteraceae bacterium]
MVTLDALQTAPKALSRFRKIAPFLLFGPISGLLIAGAVFNFRDGRPIIAGLYGMALVAFTFLLPYVVAVLGLRLI